ncbi:hypothetical protein D8B29_00870 [Verminephrobacter eiseniae]|nr:hypothetical protein [Verminephrobacter eiseniae]MCW5302693.1 hypothetical protein [Verminephrobacter eiseniae]MCW8178248.1 hypothetical protein [Verminephrobacter eiseniae]MCW8188978.1 hypothetical protein [Verminephrobacter eiseniae]
MRKYEDLFRKAYEGYAAMAWGAGAVLLMVHRPPWWHLIVPVLVLLSVSRALQVKRLWSFRLALSLARGRTITLADLMQRSRFYCKRGMLSLGRGYSWTQRHAEIADQILNRNVDELPDLPLFVREAMLELEHKPRDALTKIDKMKLAVIRKILPSNTKPVLDSDIGAPWIHGIGIEQEQDLGIPFTSLAGHTLITGTTRAGKTRLYESITAQIVDIGSALIVIDPKKDIDWVSMLKLMCRLKGRKFLYFDPAQPSKSIRLQPLQNWNTKSEPATRIGQLVDADGSFAAFAWKTLYRVHRALIATGQRPTIRNTKRYVQMGVEGLAEKLLSIHFADKHGPEWDRDLKNLPKDGKTMTRLDWCIAKFIADGESDDIIEGIISMVKHSKEHYSKMVQVLEPILEMLGSDELGDLLSPDHQDLTDKRPIYDMRRVIDEKAVLYIALDSLSNKTIASAIGSILLADLSSTLGAIYNFSTPTDAYLFVDEVAEVANDQLIQILNKGGGAGIKCFLAMQAIADLTVRLGSKDKCEQVLANLNNIISLRIRSAETAKYVSELFGEVKTRTMDVSYSSGSESSAAFTEFRSNTSRSLKAERSSLIPATLLTRLPPLHYFAFLAGRGIYKGALEFIEADREAP